MASESREETEKAFVNLPLDTIKLLMEMVEIYGTNYAIGVLYGIALARQHMEKTDD